MNLHSNGGRSWLTYLFDERWRVLNHESCSKWGRVGKISTQEERKELVNLFEGLRRVWNYELCSRRGLWWDVRIFFSFVRRNVTGRHSRLGFRSTLWRDRIFYRTKKFYPCFARKMRGTNFGGQCISLSLTPRICVCALVFSLNYTILFRKRKWKFVTLVLWLIQFLSLLLWVYSYSVIHLS